MAVPRVFISSTFYDLRYVRSDLDILADQIGVEVVRFEDGSIPYHTAMTLPEACCREIDNCQILLLVIGGRYGSVVEVDSQENGDINQENSTRSVSISRLELEHAVHSGLLTFTFVEAGVLQEHMTYKKNVEKKIDISKFAWATVDDIAVFKFIDFIKSLPGRNPIFDFRSSKDIQHLIRVQLAGLFFDLLQGKKMEKFGTHLQQLVNATENFNSLEKNVKEKESLLEQQLESLSLPDHVFYQQLQNTLKIKFPIFVRSLTELKNILSHFGFDDQVNLEELPRWNTKMLTFKNSQTSEYIALSRSFFREDGTLTLPSQLHKADIWRGMNFPKSME